MIQSFKMQLRWRLPTWDAEWRGDWAREVAEHVEEVLSAWLGTPYASGQQVRGGGVDCIRFVLAALDELYGFPRDWQGVEVPSDIAFHNRERAMASMKAILAAYEPCELVANGFLEPGDVIAIGPENGGPGHVLIAGGCGNLTPGKLYHATPPAVETAGTVTLTGMPRIFGIMRVKNKFRWRRS